MYNKTKHVVGKTGGILAIILGGFILLSVLISFISLLELPSEAKLDGIIMLALFIGLAGRAVLGILFLSFGISTLSRPVVYTFSGVSFWAAPSKGKNIALIVISSVLFFLGVLASGMVDSLGSFSAGGGYYVEFSVESGLQWIQNILCLGVMVLKIVYLCMKEAPLPSATTSKPQGQSANIAQQSATSKSVSINPPSQSSASVPSSSAVSAPKFCPNCGARFQDGNKFCPNCGEKR